MREITGNIWSTIGTADALCITTNGVVMTNGKLVMGAGIAKHAKEYFPGIDSYLGEQVSTHGNVVIITPWEERSTRIVSFPTKHDWKSSSDIMLIRDSAKQLVEWADIHEWKIISTIRPGCGHGRLTWEVVKNELAPIFDNRFCIYNDE